MAELIHIDDLAAPRFDAEVSDILAAMGDLAGDCPLDSAALHTQASHDLGLADFGPDDYRQRLDVLLAALAEVPGLTPMGIVSFHAQLLQLLKNRLLLVDRLTRHPEIHEIELVPPIIVAGLPRTGTTHLHNLLGADPGASHRCPTGRAWSRSWWTPSAASSPIPGERAPRWRWGSCTRPCPCSRSCTR